ERIASLTEHFKTHVKDNHSRRGLLNIVAQTSQLVVYLDRADETAYKTLIDKLCIRHYCRFRGIIACILAPMALHPPLKSRNTACRTGSGHRAEEPKRRPEGHGRIAGYCCETQAPCVRQSLAVLLMACTAVRKP